MRMRCLLLSSIAILTSVSASAQVTALRVGHLIDPDTATVADNQIILVEACKFTAIGPAVSVPAGAHVVDLRKRNW